MAHDSVVHILQPTKAYGVEDRDQPLFFATLVWSPALASVQSKERGEMLYEERLEAAERRRLEGNALFKAGQCRDALGKYAAASSADVWRIDQSAMYFCKPAAAASA